MSKQTENQEGGTPLPLTVAPPAKHQTPKMAEGQSAADLLKSFTDQDTQRASERVTSDDDKYQYYLRCHRGHREPAAFLLKNPGSNIVTNDQWFATYKAPGEPYQLDVYCQHCGKFDANGDYYGELVPVPLNYVQPRSRKEIAFAVPPRYLWRYAKDPEVRAKEGQHRGMRMAVEAMNHGLPASVRSREVSNG